MNDKINIKILHLSAGSISGGAARGAYWLHLGLLEIGVDSQMFINGRGADTSRRVRSITEGRFRALCNKLLRGPLKLYPSRNEAFSLGLDGLDFLNTREYRNADIIHLHWTTGLVSLLALRKIKKPIVWTVRDLWPLTGGCHYPLTCEKYTSGCGACPQLNSQYRFDPSSVISQIKKILVPKTIHFVGVSSWVTRNTENAHVSKGMRVTTIPNAVDTTLFRPRRRLEALNKWGLPANKKIILVGAQSLDDHYKGFDLFLSAIELLRNDHVLHQYHLMIFGDISESLCKKIPCEYTRVGFLETIDDLSLVYSACHVFAAPSRMDAFPKALVESMACGTPVVCFNATGTSDIVDHKITGYKAGAFSPKDFALGLSWILGLSDDDYIKISEASRERAIQKFDIRVIARSYTELYKELLNG